MIDSDLLAHISTRHGDIARHLAKYREVQAHLAALAAHPDLSVQVTVQVAGAHFVMRVPVAVLVDQHETDLKLLSSRILIAAAEPLSDIPVPAAAPLDSVEEPGPAGELPRPAAFKS